MIRKLILQLSYFVRIRKWGDIYEEMEKKNRGFVAA